MSSTSNELVQSCHKSGHIQEPRARTVRWSGIDHNHVKFHIAGETQGGQELKIFQFPTSHCPAVSFMSKWRSRSTCSLGTRTSLSVCRGILPAARAPHAPRYGRAGIILPLLLMHVDVQVQGRSRKLIFFIIRRLTIQIYIKN